MHAVDGNSTGNRHASLYAMAAVLALVMNEDVLLAYTDGVIEAMNAAREEFGEERVTAALRNGHAPVGAATADALRNAVRAFTNGATPHDDLTVIAVEMESRRHDSLSP